MKYLEKLVAIKSNENCDEIIDYIKSELKDKVEEIVVAGTTTKVLIIGINAKLKNITPIVLAGHIDTVSANVSLYRTNPFLLTEIDGKCYGLGSIDMKSFTAIILDKIQELKNFNIPIVFALTTDEETKLKSVELMTKTFDELNIKPKFTILGEPTKSEFNLSSNACYEYCVKFFGIACHSSKIKEGVNAICAMAKFISFIELNQTKYKLTSNCGVAKGGEVVNKVPDYAEINFDIRSTSPEDVNKFIFDIEEYLSKLKQEYIGLSIEIVKLLAIPAFNMLDNNKIKAIAKELNIKIDSFCGGCEAGYYTSFSGDAVIFGVGDLSLAHKPNEYVVKSEYYDYSNKLISLLECIKKYYFD